MGVIISGVEEKSPAQKGKIKPGDTLLAINGHEICDVLDYRFYLAEEKLLLTVKTGSGETRLVRIRKDQYADIGLLFDSYLMDAQRHCKNHCIFCFIDQMPPGMRDTLYFKDDDARMSFLYGNYITLTNLSRREIDRIKEMHISPINISVHTTNPQLRVRMMKNPAAGEVLSLLREFADAKIKMNAQLVLCPGINDGEELKRSLRDLQAYVPSLQTVSCVPVGLTKYRENLEPLAPYDQKGAAETLDLIEEAAESCYQKTGERVFYAGDEFYLLAKRPIPEAEYYGEFSQLENGVGMMALFRDQFLSALPLFDRKDVPRPVTIATGKLAAPFLEELIHIARETFPGIRATVYPIENEFFGPLITVAGLITGGDLMRGLAGKQLEKTLLLPDAMIKFHSDVFLDDVSIPQVEEALNVRVNLIENDGAAFLEALFEERKE